MKKLTVKQERFAELVIAGETQSAAYRLAYQSKASDNAVAVEASRLAGYPAVAARITALKERAAKRAVLTRARKLELLTKVAEATLDNPDVMAQATPAHGLAAIRAHNAMTGDAKSEAVPVGPIVFTWADGTKIAEWDEAGRPWPARQ